MRLRNIILCTLTFFLPSLTLSAQTSPPSREITGATVRVISIDAANSRFTVEFSNKTDKAITAYSILEVLTFSDGTTYTGAYSADNPEVPPGDPRWIVPGGETRIDVPAANRPNQSLVHVQVELLLVIYADRTAEVRANHGEKYTGDDMFRTILTARTALARSSELAVEAITKALGSGNENPASDALQSLEHFKSSVQDPRNEHPAYYGDADAGELDACLKMLGASPKGVEGRQFLKQRLAFYQTRASRFRANAQLRRMP